MNQRSFQSETDLSSPSAKVTVQPEFANRFEQDRQMAVEAEKEVELIIDQFASLMEKEEQRIVEKAERFQQQSSLVSFPIAVFPPRRSPFLSSSSSSESEDEEDDEGQSGSI